MAKLAPTSYPLPATDWNVRPFTDSPDHKAFEALQAASDALDIDSGEIVGGILRWQRADGYAYYLVTSERPLTLQHVPFLDAWEIEPALIRGLNKQDVLQQLHRAAKMRELFGNSTKAKK